MVGRLSVVWFSEHGSGYPLCTFITLHCQWSIVHPFCSLEIDLEMEYCTITTKCSCHTLHQKKNLFFICLKSKENFLAISARKKFQICEHLVIIVQWYAKTQGGGRWRRAQKKQQWVLWEKTEIVEVAQHVYQWPDIRCMLDMSVKALRGLNTL